ncbi:uncharacterized protein KY384_005889 [Bacidia gigantensis]|uniref:uncharacterized protein n=1 Tax=Bacidia gigantensis TaxID=2732470 RepID=UPI001D058743|nr:uncharacterized protein KY384_005889 [Bacidia gigantensis]KAG8529254.1 hypothetical protein KY384_005889 [Bacidia gigantensis]
MAESSGSSTTMHEKKSFDRSSSSPSHAGPIETTANIMAETAEEPHEKDLEKAVEAAGTKIPPVSAMDPPPDGGLEAWLVVSGAFACLFCSFGWINAIGVFQTEWEKHQLRNYTPSTISWIPSLEVFVMFAGGPIAGKLYDNYGPKWILLVGSFFHVFGLMMASISTTYYQFLLSQGLCSPIGACLIFYSAMSSVGGWFSKNRALAFGVMASGSSLGGVIFPIMVQRIIARSGFGWAMRASAFLILGMQVYANLTVKSRFKQKPTPWRIGEFIKPYTEMPFFLVVLASFFFFFGMFLPFTFIILSAEYNGMSASLAGYLLSILNAVSIFGRTLPGFVADRVGRFNIMIVTSFLSTIVVLALWLPAKGNIPYILFAAIYGFSSGAFVSLAPALIAQISDIRQLGVRTGSMFMVISFAALVGSPIGGQLIIENNGNYLHLQIFCGIMMAAGSCVFVAARASLQGFKWVKV